jgi:hypothetical protein
VSKFYVKIIYGYLYATSYFPFQLSSLFRNFVSSDCFFFFLFQEKLHVKNACWPTCIKTVWSNRKRYWSRPGSMLYWLVSHQGSLGKECSQLKSPCQYQSLLNLSVTSSIHVHVSVLLVFREGVESGLEGEA